MQNNAREEISEPRVSSSQLDIEAQQARHKPGAERLYKLCEEEIESNAHFAYMHSFRPHLKKVCYLSADAATICQ